MKEKKKSIKYRLISRVILLIVIVFVLISMVFDILISQYMKSNATQVLTDSRKYITRVPKEDQGNQHKPDQPKPGATPMGKAETVIVNSNYEILLPEDHFGKYIDNTDLLDFTNNIQSQKINLHSEKIEKLTTESELYYYTSVKDKNMENSYIVFFIKMSNLNGFKVNLIRILWIIMVFALSMTAIITYLIASRITGPITDLSDFAKKIGEGMYETIEEEFDDLELQNLKESMNETSRKLKAYDTEQRVFFQNVSHELRTPLQIIKTNAEGIEFGILEKDTACSIIKDETDELSSLVEDIIYLSRLEARSSDMTYTENDLRETLSYTVERYRSLFQRKNIELIYDFDNAPVLFTYDEKSFERAFQNLLSNALRYTRDQIIVSCGNVEGRIMIEVKDNGHGISEEELPLIFDRFYKGKKGVHGIGLSIVKSIVSSYGGRIEVKTNANGTAFTLFF